MSRTKDIVLKPARSAKILGAGVGIVLTCCACVMLISTYSANYSSHRISTESKPLASLTILIMYASLFFISNAALFKSVVLSDQGVIYRQWFALRFIRYSDITRVLRTHGRGGSLYYIYSKQKKIRINGGVFDVKTIEDILFERSEALRSVGKRQFTIDLSVFPKEWSIFPKHWSIWPKRNP